MTGNNQASYLIIGNGITGVTAAEILRAEDARSAITIVADDPFPVYYRPALKDYLAGHMAEERLWARPHTFYTDQRIRFVLGRVASINVRQQFIQLQGGQQIGYSRLLLANGARPRHLACPGLDLAGVTTLRTVVDYQQILRRLGDVKRIVVYGGGTLALESAEVLNRRGYQVTHLMRHSTLWSEVLDSVASDLVLSEERRAGIDVRTDEAITEIIGRNGQVAEVLTSSGAHIPCDLVLIAIGIEPQIDFIQPSGISCGRGVQVDETMRTNVSNIYAGGDVIETVDHLTWRTRVLGQWYPAVQQARTAAYSMLNLLDTHALFRSGTFYNATFLHGLDFAAIGLTTPLHDPTYQEIIADPQPRNYRKVLLKDGIPVGALLLGNRKQGLAFKRAIDAQINLTSIANRLFAGDFDLDDWLDQHHVPQAILSANKQDTARSSSGVSPFHEHHPSFVAGSSLQPPDGATFLHMQGSQLHANATRFIPETLLATLKDSPTLVLVTQDRQPRIVPLEQGKRFTLGRDQGNDIVLDDGATSRRHAELFTAPDGFYIRDLNSSNGVFVNKIKINNPYHLFHGDRIVIGDTLIYFSFPQPLTSPESGPRTFPERKRTTALLADASASTTGQQPVVAGLKHRTDVRPLNEKQIRFEIDMCIGCDRCMYACPVPGSSKVSIADLNQATVSEQVALSVARFTDECIMCGSCVPVCPVDNHRDLLMLSLKQRLGVSWDDPVDMNRLMALLPSGWTLPLVIGRLREQPLLNDRQRIPENYLLHLFAASQLQILAPGAVVMREGEYRRELYFILEGTLALLTKDRANNEFPVAIVGRGEYVGEYGMLTGQPHTATARAQTPALVLQVPEQVMQHLMDLVPHVHSFFDRLNSAHSIKAILKRMALFQGVRDADIQALAEQAQVKQYDRGERLFAEDERGGRPARETLHILLEGFVKVARHTLEGTGYEKTDERIIAYRHEGDYFAGGLDLLGDGGAVTVSAINRVRVAEIPRQGLLALLQQYPEVSQRFAMRLHQYTESAASVVLSQTHQLQDLTSTAALSHAEGELHSLVSGGVVEGTEVLVIDLDTCIHCSECEEACARRHGHSRMNRKGMVVSNITIATACRHCQDPVCMLCSRAGIARLPNGEVYITESCIGCGICAERCPYGAISIVNVEEEAVSRSSWQRFSDIFTKGIITERKHKFLPLANVVSPGSTRAAPGPLDASQPRSGHDELRKKIAIKCDLCAGYSNQACVQACPTGAAIRVQPTKFFGSTEDILRGRKK
ncbi:MAG TPA: FAD-dependent oxidoreductase [Ktedonobacteraceae bacterium]|nr:FAD-dependent oxidoreductase [Ktedonobacteraceae bacterium]